jgi:hypothetical protein
MNMLQLFPISQIQDHEFDWLDDRDDVVITEQAAVAVYFNPNGDIVLRQKARNEDENDSLIVVQPGFVGALARAIANTAKDAAPDSEPRDTTAAGRQRRYRERHRNVTHRNAKNREEDQLL